MRGHSLSVYTLIGLRSHSKSTLKNKVYLIISPEMLVVGNLPLLVLFDPYNSGRRVGFHVTLEVHVVLEGLA